MSAATKKKLPSHGVLTLTRAERADLLELLVTLAMRTLPGDPRAPESLGKLPDGTPDGLFEVRLQEFSLYPRVVRLARALAPRLRR
jgi:hypothetical protein